jgi:hypothetical protein
VRALLLLSSSKVYPPAAEGVLPIFLPFRHSAGQLSGRNTGQGRLRTIPRDLKISWKKKKKSQKGGQSFLARLVGGISTKWKTLPPLVDGWMDRVVDDEQQQQQLLSVLKVV